MCTLSRAVARLTAPAGTLAAAKARGRTGGRPPAMNPEKLAAARALIAAGHTGEQADSAIGVSRATLYRHLGDRAAA